MPDRSAAHQRKAFVPKLAGRPPSRPCHAVGGGNSFYDVTFLDEECTFPVNTTPDGMTAIAKHPRCKARAIGVRQWAISKAVAELLYFSLLLLTLAKYPVEVLARIDQFVS